MSPLRKEIYGYLASRRPPSKDLMSPNGSTATLVDLNGELPMETRKASFQNASDSKIEQETLLKTPHILLTQIPLTTQPPKKYVQWGVKWHRRPLNMVLFALAGIIFAIGHHFCYSALSGTRAGSERRQQWAHAFGNALAILVVSTLATTNRMVYHQYIWTLVRRKSFSLHSLDGLFSLTSDPLGFFNMDTLREAPLAVLLALLCW
jgi:hypothetical protein